MRQRLLLAVIAAMGLSVLAAGILVFRYNDQPRAAQVQDKQEQRSAPAERARIPVETSNAQRGTSSSDIRAIGSLQSDESVQIAPEIAGRVSEIAFREGEPVREGDVLVKFDDALVRAETAEQEARFALTQSNLDRADQLASRGSGTERARDEAVAAHESARATLELARVRLEKHTIRAPFSGVMGLRSASVGAFVGIGTAIVNLEKIDTLKVDFSIPEIHLGDVTVGQKIEVVVDALPGKVFQGSIYAINPMVDVNGRALRIRARLPNAGGELRPGLFARLTVKGAQERSVVVVPESAIVPRGTDSLVYRVENETAVEVNVRLGERKAGFVAVLEGLEPNTVVVTAGQQRLRNGARVEIVAASAQTKG